MTIDGGTTRDRSMLGWLPVAWVCIVLVLAARGIDGNLTAALSYSFSGAVLAFVYGSMAIAAVTLVWGLYLLWLVYKRSPDFGRQFTRWQVAVIVALVLKQLYVLAAPDFGFSLVALAWTAGEIAIGAAMIAIVRREGAAAPAAQALQMPAGTGGPQSVQPQGKPPFSVVASIGLVLLGIVLGGAIGLAVGLGGGQLYASATNISCFEGGCGYFVLFMGLAGIVVGAIAGGIFALWYVLRRRSGQPA